jgi:hypothetical protein
MAMAMTSDETHRSPVTSPTAAAGDIVVILHHVDLRGKALSTTAK